ncbi:MAG: phosphatidate cytidylyltransferase [Bacteroidales bacterium]|nr:phosphatidate cytidylyltransferase [Bacteroidales bacterium]
MNNFVKRTISGVGFAAIMLAALLTNKVIYGAVMLFALVVMMWEFLKMTCGSNYKYSQILSIIAGATLFLLVYFFKGFNLPGRLIILAFVPVFVLMINSLYIKDKSRFDKFANLYTAIIYIAVPWSVMNFSVFAPDGTFNGYLLLSFFAIIWGSDVGAYLFGITLGQKYGKKLFPSISPKKSWIGFWGGLFMAVAIAVILYFTGIFPVSERSVRFDLCNCIVLAVLLDIAGVYGDLIESQWKRHYEVKDSGTIIPGHGGLLDRFDSALIAIPIGIIYLLVWDVMCL